MPEHPRPTRFDGLACFLARCTQAIAQDGPDAVVVCGRYRSMKRSTLRLGPGGPLMTVIGWDAQARLTLLEVSAQAALDLAAAGQLYDPASPTPLPRAFP
jgi:hypothetical protein